MMKSGRRYTGEAGAIDSAGGVATSLRIAGLPSAPALWQPVQMAAAGKPARSPVAAVLWHLMQSSFKGPCCLWPNISGAVNWTPARGVTAASLAIDFE